MDTPRLSILIPNFNNGRQSAFNEDLNFIEDLIRSLVTTLADDPTSLEIIIADDGSTDDSLATLHKWASRKWPKGWREGTPIFRLIELEHCGILSIVANRL
ncbi:MAG: glycosyltransferase, partial [Planctomycetota bacterium]|nr:glycosyltransferase [Planctomycetota bacterium]